MELTGIYESVKEDLNKVNKALLEVADIPVPWLREMLELSIKGGGKRVRPILTLLAGKLYNYDLNVLLPMAASVELMHTATLIHDDAIDKSATRRGKPTIYHVYGTEKAVLLGDYLFAKAGDCVANTGSVRVIKLFCQTLMIISGGELDQAKNSFNLHQNREQYYQRIFGKTASLFSLSTESGAILTQAPESSVQALKEYGCNLGVAFQIVDDILDFVGTEKIVGKPTGSDLLQGTLTLPSMLLLEKYPKDNPVKRIFENHQDKDVAKYVALAQDMIRNSSIVDECYHLAHDYCHLACQNLEILPDLPVRRSLFNLADFVVKRSR